MAENVMERMERLGADKIRANFRVKQQQSYEFKVRYAKLRARAFGWGDVLDYIGVEWRPEGNPLLVQQLSMFDDER